MTLLRHAFSVPLFVMSAVAASPAEPVDSLPSYELDEFVITKKTPGKMGLSGPESGFTLGRTELFRAACCNLGESFCHRREAEQASRPIGELRADDDGKSAGIPRCGYALCVPLCTRTLDEKYSCVQGKQHCQKRI